MDFLQGVDRMKLQNLHYYYLFETQLCEIVPSLPRSSEIPYQRMYLLCNNCHKIISSEDVKKHIEKCKGATFNCCDCNEELQVAFIERHKECPNAIKTIAPPVYNPKSVLFCVKQ